MKALLVNGSNHQKGCTYTALSEIAKTLEAEGVACEIFQLGGGPVRDCIGCKKCLELDNACTFDDDPVNLLIKKAVEADGLIFGTPVYYSHPSGRILSALDRVFYSSRAALAHKPGAVIASARRAGTVASFDVLNKYFTISQMPVVSSTYWNTVFGNTPDEVRRDPEGLQTMRNLGKNMAWLLKCIEAGKQQGVNAPAAELAERTNFIR
jgi:multimeric flavodoxin WrbA